MKNELYQRHLALENSYNIRDIGGYATLDGCSTRWKTLLRADSPNSLTSAEQRQLLDYPVRTIIDLRRNAELQRAPAIFANSQAVRYINISLLEDERKVRGVQTLAALYCQILETCQEQMQQVLQFMASGGIFPCMVHCTIGKDRTGLIIALLLSICNVPASTIVSDYALSEQYVAPFFDLRRAQLAQDGSDIQSLEWLTTALPETMLTTLAYLDERYGSVQAYLRAIGINDMQMEYLRNSLIE